MAWGVTPCRATCARSSPKFFLRPCLQVGSIRPCSRSDPAWAWAFMNSAKKKRFSQRPRRTAVAATPHALTSAARIQYRLSASGNIQVSIASGDIDAAGIEESHMEEAGAVGRSIRSACLYSCCRLVFAGVPCVISSPLRVTWQIFELRGGCSYGPKYQL